MAQHLPIPVLVAGALPHVTNAEWQAFTGQVNVWQAAKDICLMAADPNIIHPIPPPEFTTLVGVPGATTNHLFAAMLTTNWMFVRSVSSLEGQVKLKGNHQPGQ